ncbi:TonB-dependent receptor [Alloalcanivorax marinus]|uniref:TonB-dependent receptor n=1 Tax=Alloalcanivorax marinus TaxID=1177169 RepID=UPI001957C304|nr:TonB-dependent receptor [Alloalcanivorax marinus]MBM7332918.1 TonB-dependent receptor [Alloalcanivorax marinus]
MFRFACRRFTLLPLAAALAAPLSPAVAQTGDNQLEPVTVTATRTNSALGETPQKITVVTREQIEEQLAISGDQAQVLSNLLPSYSPSRQKLTNAGETFRGRDPLFLVDGIPQSNPLRDGSRDGYTIDLAMVERIEIIHGASAEHGLGATGGIINFVTRRPQGGALKQHVGVGVSAPTDYESDGLGYQADYRVEGIQGDWDYLLGGSYRSRGLFYDGDGRAIGVDEAQGDIMDSESHDLFVKLGYWLDDNQNLELSVNRFELEGNHDYVNVPGDRAAGVPATSRKGVPRGRPVRNQALTTSLAYRHLDLAGNDLKVQFYSQRFRARYGGGTFGTYQDPAYGPNVYDQSQNESEKYGAKFTVNRDGLLDDRLKVTAGLDLLQDETRQVLVLTGRDWVPEARFRNAAPFLQLDYRLTDRLTVHGGARHEYAKLNVDTYQVLASYGGHTVTGGSPSFEETLFNGGLVFRATDWMQWFANYSEGFGMPDVGRVLRGVNQPGQDVDDYVDLQPIVTENQEIGVRLNRGAADLELSYYQSNADLGSVLVLNNGVYEVERKATDIHGVEADLGWRVREGHRVSVGYAHVSGEEDSNGNGVPDQRMDARNISPDRVTVRWQANWNDRLTTQLQGNHYFSRRYDRINGRNANFDSYQLFDLFAGYRLARGQVTLGVENLFNEQYITFFSQSASDLDERYFAGRGRVVSLGYNLDF